MLGVLTTYPTWGLDGNIREFESQKVCSTKRHICFSVVTLSEKKIYIVDTLEKLDNHCSGGT